MDTTDRDLNRAINEDFAELLAPGPEREKAPREEKRDWSDEPLRESVMHCLKVECPICHAPIGARCTRLGLVIRGVHSDRDHEAYRQGYRTSNRG